MIYRELGRTGLKVSQLGFGSMRLPMRSEGEGRSVDRELAIPLIHRAFDAGVNYVDSAPGYCADDSEGTVGEALVGRRDKVVVSTKNMYYGDDEAAWWKNLENSLERLRVDCIDVYHHHAINWAHYVENVEPRVARWMLKAKEQGLVKHIACSFHDTSEALMKLIDTGYPSVLTVQYNMLDRQLEEGIAHAHEKGIGIAVMGPVAGGRLGAPNEVFEGMLPQVRRVPELALRFVLSNPNVSIALSGMSTMEQVEENLSTAADEVSLSEEDRAAIAEHLTRLQQMADLYCTGCGYCMPCPNEVDIPGIFAAYNQARVYNLWGTGRAQYSRLLEGRAQGKKAADACVECGECEEKCPQHIPIREQLKEAHKALAPEGQ